MKAVEIRKEYNVDELGLIMDPGRFEAEMYYIVHFHDLYMNGCGNDITYDEYDRPVDVFIITKEDAEEFPELKDYYAVTLWCDDSGFYFLDYYLAKEELEKEC